MAPLTLYRQLPPPPPLADFVRYFWVAEGPEISLPYHYSSVATGLAQLTFQYHGSFFAACVDHSAAAETEDLSSPEATSATQGLFGVALYPYTAHLLFNRSAPTQKAASAENMHQQLRQLEEQMQAASCHPEREALLVQFLTNQLLPNSLLQDQLLPLIKADIDAGHVTDMKRLFDQMHLSRRQFERRFKALLGQSPREYAKMQRFRFALQQFQKDPTQSFTQLALSSGYYDQAHFNRDFKELAGVTPKEYFSGEDLVPGLLS